MSIRGWPEVALLAVAGAWAWIHLMAMHMSVTGILKPERVPASLSVPALVLLVIVVGRHFTEPPLAKSRVRALALFFGWVWTLVPCALLVQIWA